MPIQTLFPPMTPRSLFNSLLFIVVGLFSAFAVAEDEAEPHPQDPYESFNRVMYDINKVGDDYVVRPIAKAYKYVTPSIVDQGVTNFFDNLGDVETFANSLLQAKFYNATITFNRILFNTTFGLGGLIDVASYFGLENDEEDFGQTLAAWGYENSDYLVLPILGPSTFRDLGGRVVDTAFFDPVNHYEEISSLEKNSLTALKLIDLRADLLSAEGFLQGGDPYVLLRNAYLQNREFLINDGEVEDSFADEEFEDLDGF